MRIFLAGATGVIGRPLARRLAEAGHEVTGTTRSPAKAEWLSSMGVRPAVCDALDRSALERAVAEARPEVVLDQLTDLPREFNVLRFRSTFYRRFIPLRRDGSTALLEAARAADARQFISQTVSFTHAPAKGRVVDESAPEYDDPPRPWDEVKPVLENLARRVLDADDVDGAVLRYGFFYGPGTSYASDGMIAEGTRRRQYPLIGDGAGLFSFIHLDDAVEATVAAIDRGAKGAFHVVDDEPVAMREWLPDYANVLGAKPPRRVPPALVRLVAGGVPAFWATEMPGASNTKAREELGWAPRYPSFARGIREALG